MPQDKRLEEIFNKVWIDFDDNPNNYSLRRTALVKAILQEYVRKDEVLKLVLDSLPKVKDVSGRFYCNTLYKTPLKDGDMIHEEYVNYDQREGYNQAIDACREAINKALSTRKE